MSSMFGFGRPQPSSAEKIAAAEQEMDLVTDMFNKSVTLQRLHSVHSSYLLHIVLPSAL